MSTKRKFQITLIYFHLFCSVVFVGSNNSGDDIKLQNMQGDINDLEAKLEAEKTSKAELNVEVRMFSKVDCC